MTDTVIDRLNSKKLELEERLAGQNQQWGSQRREALQYKIKKIEELITAYQSTPLPINSTEAKETLDQQVGFEEQKRKILERLEINESHHNIRRNSLIFCLVGPSGTGKTSFASLLSQALKKEFFSVNLGGLSDASILLGNSENSSGTETGQLAKALIETKKSDPLILLDEIDKAGSSFKTAIHDCLLNVLDPEQNHEVLDYYLDVKLDFSQITFVTTANDLTKIPQPLRDRMLIIELPGYNIEQKKEIAQKIIQNWFNQNGQFERDNLEISSEALETLINKTNEKGVRQLKMALDIVFEYCLLQWTRETESKIIITPDLVNQIIPQPFSNINYEGNQEQTEKDGEKLQSLHKELKTLRWEKDKLTKIVESSNQNKLKASKFHALIIIKKALNKVKLEKNKAILDNRDYEKEISNANSPEEVEVIREEVLLSIVENFPEWGRETTEKTKPNYSSNYSLTKQKDHEVLEKLVKELVKIGDNRDNIQNLENKLAQNEQKTKEVVEQLNSFQQNATQEAQKLKKEIQSPEKQKNDFNWSINGWFILFVVSVLFIVGLIIHQAVKKVKKWQMIINPAKSQN